MPTSDITYDPIRAASELREQLSSHSRRLGFLLADELQTLILVAVKKEEGWSP